MLLFSTILGSLYIVSVVIPERMDADLVVPSLASLKNPTLYYWGQDRLLSLIPLMLLPFRNIEWNLYFNTFFQATFFCALVLLILRSITSDLTHSAAFLIISLVLINYTIPAPQLFTFAKHAQPYVPSTAIVLAAYYINSEVTKSEAWEKQKLICIFLSTTALLLNPLTLIFAISLSLAQLSISSLCSNNTGCINISNSLKWAGILLPSFLITVISRHVYSQNYVIAVTNLGIKVSNLAPAMKITIHRFIDSFNGNPLMLVIAGIGFLTCIYTFLSVTSALIFRAFLGNKRAIGSTFGDTEATRPYKVISCAAILNLFTLIPVLSSEWYVLNIYDLRYNFPLYFAIIVGLCRIVSLAYYYLIVALQVGAEISRRHSVRFIKPATLNLGLLSGVVAILIGSFRPISPNLLSYNEFSRVYPIYTRLSDNFHTSEDTFIGGNYWLSWPIKALGLRDGNDIGVITYRSRFDPVSRQREDLLDDRIKKGEEFSFVCLSEGPDTSDCRSFLKGKIHNLSSDPESWQLNVPIKPISFSIHGDTYATTIQYKILQKAASNSANIRD